MNTFSSLKFEFKNCFKALFYHKNINRRHEINNTENFSLKKVHILCSDLA